MGGWKGPGAGRELGTCGDGIRDDRSRGGLDFTHMFSPTLLSEARFGVSRNAQREHILAHGHPTAAQLGMPGTTTDPMLEGFPLINVTNYLPVGYAANEPVQFFVPDYQWSEKLTWIKASHVLKWGADISRNQFKQPYSNNSRGTRTANGNWTGAGTASNGNAVADLELGLLKAASITTQTARNYMRLTDYGLFVNDDWKISHSLTLNLGLRYELDKPPVDRVDRVANFIPALNKIIIASDKNLPNYNQLVSDAGLSNLMGVAKDYGIQRSLVDPSYKGFAPRAGFAWRPLGSGKMVLRGGYGIFYSGQLLNDVRNGLDNTFPFVLAQNFARLAADPAALTLENPFNPARGTQTGTTTSTGYQLHPPMGYLQSYNLTVERDIGLGAVSEIGYVGSKGTHLGRQYDINLPFRSIAYYQANLAFPVPYPPLRVIDYWDFTTHSIYNAGQVTLRPRASGGFFYRLSYSYSKSIDTASQFTGTSTLGFANALDPRHLSLERARSDWDRGHVFQSSFAWPVTVARGFLG